MTLHLALSWAIVFRSHNFRRLIPLITWPIYCNRCISLLFLPFTKFTKIYSITALSTLLLANMLQGIHPSPTFSKTFSFITISVHLIYKIFLLHHISSAFILLLSGLPIVHTVLYYTPIILETFTSFQFQCSRTVRFSSRKMHLKDFILNSSYIS